MRILITFAVAIVALLSKLAYSQEVYKCGNVYSDEPCKGATLVDTATAVSDPQGAKTKLIYLCKRPDKTQPWWIHEQCSYRRWTVIDSVRVPSNLTWDEQVTYAERKRAQQQQQQQQTRPHTPNYSQPTVSMNNTERCNWLDRRIKQLDNMGRAGSRYYNLEYIRNERQNARDEQFSLRC